MFGSLWFKIGAGVALLLIVVGFGFTIKAGIDKIEAQGKKIESLETDLANEKVARERDVQGLTVLTKGIVDASAARALDERALGETIDASNPTPVSADLAAFLDRLRSGRSPGNDPAPTGRTDPAAGTGAGARPVQR